MSESQATVASVSPQFPGLSITLFGPLQVLVNGEPIPHLRSRKAQWLLCLLTLRHGKPVQREWLAGTLWPDVDQTQAFANLRPALSELRKALGSEGGRLQSPTRNSLLLDLTDAEVDVLAFDTAMANKSLAGSERAVSLCRGPLLEGCTEEWVVQDREVREQNCRQALQALASTASQSGAYDAAAGYWRRAVALDPRWEVPRRGLMEVLALSGDDNAALQVYREFLRALQSNDARAVPHEETTAMYRRLREQIRLRATSSASPAKEDGRIPRVSGSLHHSLTELIGREDERMDVARQLRRSRIVTIVGPGGIGKTRLADAVVGDCAAEYEDGVWLIGLETLPASGTSSDEGGQAIARQIAFVLGVKEVAGHSMSSAITKHLCQKRALLVLDNCEHVIESCAKVASQLLRECKGVRILATSREALRISGESAWAVPSLATPDPKHLPDGKTTAVRAMIGYDAVQLFVERAKAAQKAFSLTGDNARYVATVCSRLEGIPLAIELAATRVKSMTVEQIAERLDSHLGTLGLLTGGSRTASSRQQTLRAALGWSFDLLGEPEKVLLRRLSVFAGGWTLPAAEQVCAGSGIEPGTVLDLLTSLIDKSLVVFTEVNAATGGRYRFLEIVRQYAAEQIQASGETQSVRTRHLDWCVAVATETLEPSRLEASLPSLEDEHDNFRSALAWCASDAGGAETGMCLASNLWRFWWIRGYSSEGARYLTQFLDRDGAQARTLVRAHALIGAGTLSPDCQMRRIFTEEGLSIYRELGDQSRVADALNRLGNAEADTRNYALAEPYYQEALSLARDLGNEAYIAWSLNNLGDTARLLGDFEKAKPLLEESLRLRRKLPSKDSIAASLINLGALACDQDDLIAAQQYLEEGLGLSREVGSKDHLADALFHLGNLARKQEDLMSAHSCYKESLGISHELGSDDIITGCLAGCLEGLAGVMYARQRVKEAVCLWGASSAIYGRIEGAAHPSEASSIEAARLALGDDTFVLAWEAGRALTLEQAVAFAGDVSI